MPEKKNSYNDVEMKRICNVCGVYYSMIISFRCPVCQTMGGVKSIWEAKE